MSIEHLPQWHLVVAVLRGALFQLAREATWRAGAASVLSEAVGATDARSAPSVSASSGSGVGGVGAAGTGSSATRGVRLALPVGNAGFYASKAGAKRQASRPEYSLGNKDQTASGSGEAHPARRASRPTAAQGEEQKN